MLESGFITKNRYTEMIILARYYFYLGKTERAVKTALNTFCSRHIEYFSRLTYSDYISKAIRKAKNTELKIVDKVSITNAEMKAIKKLDNINCEKVAFTMLVIYKSMGCKKFRATVNEILDMAGVSADGHSRDRIMWYLTSNNIIESNTTGYRWVKIVDNTSPVALDVHDFENINLAYYKYYNIKKVKECSRCKCLFEANNNKQKYCVNCAKIVKNEKNKGYYHALRKIEIS